MPQSRLPPVSYDNPLYKNLQMRNWFLCKLKLTKIKDKLSEC